MKSFPLLFSGRDWKVCACSQMKGRNRRVSPNRAALLQLSEAGKLVLSHDGQVPLSFVQLGRALLNLQGVLGADAESVMERCMSVQLVRMTGSLVDDYSKDLTDHVDSACWPQGGTMSYLMCSSQPGLLRRVYFKPRLPGKKPFGFCHRVGGVYGMGPKFFGNLTATHSHGVETNLSVGNVAYSLLLRFRPPA
jgi:hypothetical protein